MAQKVTTGVYKGVTTSELDDLAAETAASMTATHPDYATVARHNLDNTLITRPDFGMRTSSEHKALLIISPNLQLAARIAVSNLHKNTMKSFSET